MSITVRPTILCIFLKAKPTSTSTPKSNQRSNREVLLLIIYQISKSIPTPKKRAKSPGLSIFHRVETCRLSGENVSIGHQPVITVAHILANPST